MYRTFNCGVAGIDYRFAERRCGNCPALLQQTGEQAWVIGQIEHAEENEARYHSLMKNRCFNFRS